MKQPKLTRRRFLQLSAFSAGGAIALPALGLASVAAAPSSEAQAAATQPQIPDALPKPTFSAIAPNTTFGPLTDISMGWDGTLWGIDSQGAPHIYDAINDVWEQHGDGIDAAAIARVSATEQVLYVFQGSNVIAIDPTTFPFQVTAVTTIAALWPNLPHSFQLGVAGAATNPNGLGLILFNGGRYVSTDGSVPVSNLTDLTNWPQASKWPIWQNGVIDGVISYNGIFLMREGQVLGIDLVKKSAPSSPLPFSQLIGGVPIPQAWKTSGIDAWTITTDPVNHYQLVFEGATVFMYNPASGNIHGTSMYLGNAFGNWPATLHPVLAHAPSGRDGNLWSVLPSAQDNWIMQHNGESWQKVNNQADHVGVGQDNTVMIASAQKLWKFTGTFDGYGFTPVSPANNLIQVSLGHANAVFARDSNNNVYSFDPGSGTLTPNTLVGTALHIATTNDGTLWHTKPNDANIHRLLTTSANASQPIPVQQSVVTSVNKVAATGFGASHCLVTDTQNVTQAYRYDSPYLFKSPNDYFSLYQGVSQLTQGLGNIYLVDYFANSVVAIDTHTGVELSRSAPAGLNQRFVYTNPVLDTVNELVYVATYLFSDPSDTSEEGALGNLTTPATVYALSARDLSKVAWTYPTGSSVNVAPSLVGNTLVFGDRTGTIFAIDTVAAAAAAAQNTSSTPITAATKAVWELNQLNGFTVVPGENGVPQNGFATFSPAIAFNGQYFLSLCLTYAFSNQLPFYALYFYSVLLDPTTQGVTTYNATAYYASSQHYTVLDFPLPCFNQNTPPIYQHYAANALGGNPEFAAIYLACDDAVVQLMAPAPNLNQLLRGRSFKLPTGSTIQSGLGWDASDSVADAKMFCGDQNGTLYGFDIDLNPLSSQHLPVTIAPNARIVATPLPYTDPLGNKTIIVGAVEKTDAGNLYGFDPVSGNISSMETGTMQVSAMSPTVTHGTLYVAGQYFNSDSTPKITQVMGIRAETITQGQRDFVIESQLMQDPDEAATDSGIDDTTNPIPPSVARYQTHLTVVDDQKNPMPNEPVKIWADVNGTAITVDGKPYTIGPDDAAFASVTTGSDGSLVIMSTATDLNASALRVWAAFMNPFERIVVYPDHEWHGRAASSNADPTQTLPDPSKPNLSIAHGFKPDPSDPTGKTPKPLFTSNEVTQGTSANVANAIGQMRTGLNPGGNSAVSVASRLKTLHASDASAPYIAYTTLPSMHYGPTNARVKRTATIVQPFGFQLSKPQGGTHTYTPLTHSAARSAIDALPYPLWDPNNPSGKPAASAPTDNDKPVTFYIRRTDDAFTNFWSWLVQTFNATLDKIENVIVSVAEDIMVGINFIIGQVEQAFKAVIKIIDDVVNAIGTFFIQLLKAIEDLIEALCVLFHFGEIIWFHNWIKKLINHQVDGLEDALKNNVKGSFDNFILAGEDTIKAQFDVWRGQISGQGINDLKGGKATVHTAFTIKDSSGNSSSQGVVAGANAQKMKSNMGSGKETSLGAAKAGAATLRQPSVTEGVQDTISNFVTTFVSRVTNDGDLSGAFEQLKSDFSNLFNSQSGSQFAASAVSSLLDLLETALLALISVAGAFFDTLFTVIDALIAGVQTFMNTPLDIPFFSWLYKLVFGSDLTILDLIALVGSIPGTMIFRVAIGTYPQYAGLPPAETLPNGSSTNPPPPTAYATTLSAVARRTGAVKPQATHLDLITLMKAAAGVINGLCILGAGIVSMYGDAVDEGLPDWINKAGFVLNIMIAALSVPLIYTDISQVGKFDWASFGVTAFIALSGGVSLFIHSPATSTILTVVQAFDNACCLAFTIFAYIDDKETDTAAIFNFIGNIMSTLPGIVNPVKYLGEIGKIVAVFADIVFNLVWCGTTIAAAFTLLASSEPPLRLHKQYLPSIAQGSAPA